MSNLSYKVRGVKGGDPKWTEKTGEITVFPERFQDKYIHVESYSGFGDSYKKRDVNEIRICENGKYIFEGSFDELAEIIKSKK